ncbi:hypothetical protein CEW89_07455 [Celeribacter ethanolicus]|uniref:SPOR domain-containing protein n=2 Tax=Celeribacter ethanolicus TaxID=1758178 RepID=A0A291GAI3_9RHOB|nr:hypothetical protein CEW89_07455 [Celeribacter ethanolicus]
MYTLRYITHAALAATVLLTGAQGAMATIFSPYEKSSVKRGEMCEIFYEDRGHIGPEGLTKARDFGNGFVAQDYVEFGSKLFVLSDCARAEALVIGPIHLSVGAFSPEEAAQLEVEFRETPFYKATKEAETHAANGTLDLSVLRDRYQSQVETATLISVAKKVVLDIRGDKPMHRYDLGCGCKFFYPESAGAS